MRFPPVLLPAFPVLGIIVLQTLLAIALCTERKRCSLPFLYFIGVLELVLICINTVTGTGFTWLILGWDMLLMGCRLALGPLLVWMALELNGFKPWKLSAKRFFFLVYSPLLVVTVLLFTNGIHHLYWPNIRMVGRMIVADRGLLSDPTMYYSQVVSIAGIVLFAVGIPRHYGKERIRLVIFLVCFLLIYLGDSLWRLSVPLPYGIHPLSFFMTIGSYLLGISVWLFGFPRAQSPIPKEPILSWETIRESAPFPAASFQGFLSKVLGDSPGLSERQREVAAMVVDGLSYRAIAERLGLTERTVKYHMGQILDKCGLETREQFIAWIAAKCARAM